MAKAKDKKESIDIDEYQRILNETHEFTNDILKLDPKAKEKLKYVLIGANLKSSLEDNSEE